MIDYHRSSLKRIGRVRTHILATIVLMQAQLRPSISLTTHRKPRNPTPWRKQRPISMLPLPNFSTLLTKSTISSTGEYYK